MQSLSRSHSTNRRGFQVGLILPNQIAKGQKEWTMFPLRERGGPI